MCDDVGQSQGFIIVDLDYSYWTFSICNPFMYLGNIANGERLCFILLKLTLLTVTFLVPQTQSIPSSLVWVPWDKSSGEDRKADKGSLMNGLLLWITMGSAPTGTSRNSVK